MTHSDVRSLICSSPQVESALVYAVKPAGLLLYLPKYGMRTAVHLLDKAGLPKPIFNHPEERSDDPAVLERRKLLDVEVGKCPEKTGFLWCSQCAEATYFVKSTHLQVRMAAVLCSFSMQLILDLLSFS